MSECMLFPVPGRLRKLNTSQQETPADVINMPRTAVKRSPWRSLRVIIEPRRGPQEQFIQGPSGTNGPAVCDILEFDKLVVELVIALLFEDMK